MVGLVSQEKKPFETSTLSGFIHHNTIQEGTSAAHLFILQHYGLIKKKSP